MRLAARYNRYYKGVGGFRYSRVGNGTNEFKPAASQGGESKKTQKGMETERKEVK